MVWEDGDGGGGGGMDGEAEAGEGGLTRPHQDGHTLARA